MNLLLAGFLLAVPVTHLARDHSVLRPGRYPTAHERRHASRPLRLRLLVNAAWVVYLAGAVAVGLFW